MPELRPAHWTDYAEIERIHAQHAPVHHLSEREYKGWLGRCTVAADGERVLGFCLGEHDRLTWQQVVVDPSPPEDWTSSDLEVLVVDVAQRRRGIGALLVGDFIRQAAAAGSHWVLLNPGSQTPGQTAKDLLAFYGNLGFFPVEHRPEKNQPEWYETDHGLLGAPAVPDPPFKICRLISSTDDSSR